MSKPAASARKSTRRFRRAPFIAMVAAAILAVTAITVISGQRSGAKPPVDSASQNAGPNASASHNRTYVTNPVHGQDIHVASSTDEIKPLTPQEAERLAAELGPMLDQSTQDVPQVRHADGSVSMDLDGRFQNVTVARVNKDGTVSQSCVDNPRAAGKFFGIDPQLIEKARPRRTKINQN